MARPEDGRHRRPRRHLRIPPAARAAPGRMAAPARPHRPRPSIGGRCDGRCTTASSAVWQPAWPTTSTSTSSSSASPSWRWRCSAARACCSTRRDGCSSRPRTRAGPWCRTHGATTPSAQPHHHRARHRHRHHRAVEPVLERPVVAALGRWARRIRLLLRSVRAGAGGASCWSSSGRRGGSPLRWMLLTTFIAVVAVAVVAVATVFSVEALSGVPLRGGIGDTQWHPTTGVTGGAALPTGHRQHAGGPERRGLPARHHPRHRQCRHRQPRGGAPPGHRGERVGALRSGRRPGLRPERGRVRRTADHAAEPRRGPDGGSVRTAHRPTPSGPDRASTPRPASAEVARSPGPGTDRPCALRTSRPGACATGSPRGRVERRRRETVQQRGHLAAVGRRRPARGRPPRCRD